MIWGRAYFAQLDGCILFFRDGVIEDYSWFWGFFKIPDSNNDGLRWIQDDGYMDCVWALAEGAARRTATDNVRIDIFLQRGNPNGCKVNENSLSSGLLYWGHEDCAAFSHSVALHFCSFSADCGVSSRATLMVLWWRQSSLEHGPTRIETRATGSWTQTNQCTS